MREIKFRGYDGAKWVYGSAVRYDEYHSTWFLLEIGAPDDDWLMVGNVDQYIGLNDRLGNEIYENDIVEIDDHPFDYHTHINGEYIVHYNEVMELCCGHLILHRQLHYAEVVGNRFEREVLNKL